MVQHYDKELKLYAVKMVVEDGKKIAEVARELDLVPQTVQKWVVKYKEELEGDFVGSGNRSPKDKEEYEKDKRIHALEEEVAILKKAKGIFAKNRSSLRLYRAS
ncbi:transposase [Oceanobacillus sp. GSFE11]|uniref:Transposase n=1 Tax=Oceanobacillus jordanicus TaxID=2867266 RepID=A0AAW5B5V9_9BACI|nr:transposase [Oceanobacillus jordanicus]MCG3420038.1 transposase [Oceanobacillus jordanicus]